MFKPIFHYKRSIFLIICATLICAGCSKDKKPKQVFYGVWVETTLRLDTLDFEFATLNGWSGEHSAFNFSTNTYLDTLLNPFHPVNHSDIYEYFFNTTIDEINMKGMLSSSSTFLQHQFNVATDKRSFTIEKFYARRSLPATVEFVRIR